ncbi:hypothetical protein J2TS4_33310 [Paenibacillus sp. J2TS4]|nr:hypothetical protein J2TS4_33310 [Paenibacillus sp. J2TS4]
MGRHRAWDLILLHKSREGDGRKRSSELCILICAKNRSGGMVTKLGNSIGGKVDKKRRKREDSDMQFR